MAAKLHAEQSAKLEAEQMCLELSTEEQAERERQRELADADKRRRLREQLQQAQRDDVTQFEMKQKEQHQMEHYQLQQVTQFSLSLISLFCCLLLLPLTQQWSCCTLYLRKNAPIRLFI